MKRFLFIFTVFHCTIFGGTPKDNLSSKPQISFRENKGQICDQNYKPRTDVLFSGTDGALTFHIKKTGISYQLYKVNSWRETKKHNGGHMKIADLKQPDEISVCRIDANWINTNSKITIQTGKTLPDYTNYYLEYCPNGILNVKSHKEITLKNIYNNIDLHYYEKNGVLKYDYIIAPNTNYKQIKIEIKGAEIKLQKSGSILLETPLGKVEEGKPIAFQNGKQLKAKWIVNRNSLSFEVEEYDPSLELVIDPPTRIWGTYYGGAGSEGLMSCETDNAGNVLAVGFGEMGTGGALATTGAYQTTVVAQQDGAVVKFTASGSRVWGTYYGANSIEAGYSCAVDKWGNVYMTMSTNSTGTTMATPAGHQTAFGGAFDLVLVKFDPNGVRLWGTYYGAGGDEGINIEGVSAVDPLGNIYICGYTNSPNFIATTVSHQSALGGSYDAFIVKFDSSGTRLWATYYGGNAYDAGIGCVTDKFSNVYLTGGTSSNSSIATPGAYQTVYTGVRDGFLVKFDSAGVRQWGTYYGGPLVEEGYTCATDTFGNVFMAGMTESSVSIATPGSHQSTFGGGGVDSYLVKFDSAGVRQWATYYGANCGGERAYSCATDQTGNVYMCGNTNCTIAIASPGSYQSANAGAYDSYLAKFNSAGIRLWGTYYGSSGFENGISCWVIPNGTIYMAGISDGFNVGSAIATPGSFQTNIVNTLGDGFLVKFNDCIPDNPKPISGTTGLCIGAGAQTYSVPLISTADSYSWSLPVGWTGTSTTNIISVTPGTTGGTISITATNTCGVTPPTILTISVNPQPTITVNSGAICRGKSFTITPSGASTYTYSSGFAIVTPTANTSYTIIGANGGCIGNAAISNVTVNPLPVISATSPSAICSGSTGCLNVTGASTYTWSGPCGFTAIQSSVCFPFNPSCKCTYSVVGEDINGCTNSATLCLNVVANPTVSANTSNLLICSGQTSSLTANGAGTYSWSTGATTSIVAVTPSITTTYSVVGTNTNGCQGTATITQSVSACTEISETSNGGEITISPNPNSGEFAITFDVVRQNLSIEIYNTMGQMIKQERVSELNTKINLREQASGVYFIKVLHGLELVHRSKIIKQ